MGVLIPVAIGRDNAVAPDPPLNEDVCGCTSCGEDKNRHFTRLCSSTLAFGEQRIQRLKHDIETFGLTIGCEIGLRK